MKKNRLLRFGLTVLILMSAGAMHANAQDVGSPSFDAYEKDPAEIEFFTRGDSSDVYSAKKKNDSVSVRMPMKRNVYKPAPVVPKAKSESDPDDNSVLSFNFLYYLIQKYKMQDIVD